ncbi:MAG TPA: radical SAM family heme chaperone HemW [Actinomycetota bacterium]|nr:radical SAM family heme chaperone HemW [Actinomycetota bacterium]
MTPAAPALAALPTAPALRPGRGVYVHIPFCLVHCPYCDFNAHAGMDDVKAPYVEALIREVEAAADGGPVDTIAFGGGTPTELAPGELGRILAALRSSFAVAPGAEIGLEANPESVDRAGFDALLESGFTRVSLGVQSLTPSVLEWLGRAHGPARALGAVRDAVAAGFEHVNADLMFGTPGESAAGWRASLEGVLETGVDHVSTYALTVEERTPLATWVARGRVAAPDDDEQADRYQAAAEVLRPAGLVRYEVSNWAKPGCWSRHNVGYWTGAGYLGFGAGAHSLAAGRRWWNVRSPRTYVELAPAVEEDSECLAAGERAAEAAMLGLRLAGGIDRPAFESVWGVDPAARWAAELAASERLGLVSVTPERVALTDDGFFLWGHVARSLLG